MEEGEGDAANGRSEDGGDPDDGLQEEKSSLILDSSRQRSERDRTEQTALNVVVLCGEREIRTRNMCVLGSMGNDDGGCQSYTTYSTTVQWNTDICITLVPANLMQISVEPYSIAKKESDHEILTFKSV